MNQPDPTTPPPGGPVELPADLRAGGAAYFALFLSFCQAGFTPSQALYLVGQAIREAFSQGTTGAPE